ncbi:MAG: hypothetical protein Kow0068_03040 [Marinilabiliales bacterium]
MLTKEYIKELKNNGNGAIGEVIKRYNDSSSLTFILENLGQLPKDFDGSFLPDLLTHKNSTVRLWAVKTIGKLEKEEFLPLLKQTALNDSNTNVRREAVSSIGKSQERTGNLDRNSSRQ